MLIVPLKVRECAVHTVFKDKADVCYECLRLGFSCIVDVDIVAVVVIIIYPDNKFAC